VWLLPKLKNVANKSQNEIKASESYCRMCQKILPNSKFYETTNPMIDKSGWMSVCKEHANEIYNTYFSIYNNMEKALYLTCQDLDVMFSVEALRQTQSHIEGLISKGKKADAVFGYYKSKLGSTGKNNANLTSFRFKDSDNIFDEKDNEILSDSYNEVQDEDLVSFWGKGYTYEELNFLQDYYYELIKIYDHSLPVQINNYRNMAKTQLQGNKCLEKGDISGYEKSMKILSMLSGDSNIKPNQETSVGNLTKGGYDVFLKHIEDDEPILDWEKDLGHIDKLKSMLNIFFFGHFAKVLNIANPWKSKYDEEMKQYTVEDEDLEEDKTQVDFLGEL
jgi:hypothetical protein